MKTKDIIQRLSLFLFALVLAIPAWTQGNNDISIGSKADWQAFCNRVNNGETGLNAIMTADVDLGTDIVMLGTDKSYSGTFDGQGYTLSFNWTNTDERTAPFKYVNGATIKNLRTQGKIASNSFALSGLIYCVDGTTTVSGCVSDVDLMCNNPYVTNQLGGMLSYRYYGSVVTFTDCVVKGNITAMTDKGKKGMGGFINNDWAPNTTMTLNNCLYLGTNNAGDESYTFAPADATINNCYYLNTCGEAQGTQVTKKQLESGEVAHKLQNGRSDQVWGQVLGKDKQPLLTAEAPKRVYKVDFTLNGEVKATRYANTGKTVTLPTAKDLVGESYIPNHYYAIIFEGDFNGSTPVDADRTVAIEITEKDCYEIATKEDWKAFCALVNSGQNAVDAKMTADIELGSDIVMVGTPTHKYGGTFDGRGHTLSFQWTGTNDVTAPFKFVNGATIRNLRTQGKIASKSSGLAGLIYCAYGVNTVSGCVSDVDIVYSDPFVTGGLGGMVSRIFFGSDVTFTDCIVKGDITATNNIGKRGIGGFVCNEAPLNTSMTMNNCLYIGTNNAGRESYTFGKNAVTNNCYYLHPCGEAQGTQVTEAQLKSGEITKRLQGDRTDACYWAQQLGEMPDLYSEGDKSKTNYVYYDTPNAKWACENFVLTDGTPLPIGIDFTAATVTNTRTLAADKATLCLPYELPISGFKAYILSNTQGNAGAVRFKKVNDRLEAYKPYLLTANGTPQLGGNDIEVKAFDNQPTETIASGYVFKSAINGVDNATAAAANAYILQDDGKFHKVTTDNTSATIPPYRAYITRNGSQGAKEFSIFLDDETTDIHGVTGVAPGMNGRVYDLQGRRQKETRPGVNIVKMSDGTTRKIIKK